MLLTLGLTESDRANDYIPSTDGYRHDATQELVALNVYPELPDVSGEEWAEAAYLATNLPPSDHDTPAVTALRTAITHHIAEHARPFRSLSCGDTVTVHSQIWACHTVGFGLVRRTDTADQSAGPDDFYELCTAANDRMGMCGRPLSECDGTGHLDTVAAQHAAAS